MDTAGIVACSILILIAIISLTDFSELKEKKAYIKQQYKRVLFYVRWWIIGRYFCKTKPLTLGFYNVLNKIFWGIMLVGICLVVAEIMDRLQWIL